ncbi:SCO family protein [Sporosarcina sp. ANT_H38]|uniref:SCO family protein n=1 Tax=Sporosarcina sp. ANT_H38 TaxID=2597358 RepID=UPI0011F0DE33|nr:SCO family protein [Sporosarcina sp. ANT_H38]KAA0965727.1 SCO family protein [Sporosarcina sp. ANT_H38]
MRKKLVLPYLLLIVLILSACSGGFKEEHNYKIEPFEFTNQHNAKVSLDDMKGKVWLAQFIFTVCTSACPPMMSNMADLDKQLIDEGVEDYKIVSFSIDPTVDTPELLQEYLDLYDVQDQSKWEMLTGYSQEKITDFAAKSFKTLVADIPDSDQVMHATYFSLVNKKGEVVKTYNGMVDVPFDQIVKDMKALSKEGA